MAPPVSAQVTSDDFRIRVAGATDTEAPTTPTLLSVIPTTHTQIDITWSAATDNAIVSGYSLLRDGVPIATTSLLSYADTGLIASTTYMYAVRAFDPTLNYSSTSNSIATTTLQSPPEPVAIDDTGGSSVARVVLKDFRLMSGISTTSVTLVTAHPSRIELRWGKTGSYELGYLASDTYTTTHDLLVTDLDQGITYEYELIGYTPGGYQTILKRGMFTTLMPPVIEPPQNVSWFTALRTGTTVELSWRLPGFAEFAQVRIVGSHLGFPKDPHDGAVVYQGTEEVAYDVDALVQYSPVYYTAFVYDRAGNVSSGAVAIAYAAGDGAATGTTPVVDTASSTVSEEATSTIVGERVTVDMKMPTLADFSLFQVDKTFTFIDPQIRLSTNDSFIISLPKAAVAGNLKSIIATITDPTDQRRSSSFLLRINAERTAYEAHVAATLKNGESKIIVTVYDYEAFVVGTYQVPVAFVEPVAQKRSMVLFPDVFFTYGIPSLFGTSVLLMLFFIILVLRRRPQNKTTA